MSNSSNKSNKKLFDVSTLDLSFLDLSKCKVKYTYLTDENGNPYDIVSNMGLKKYEKSCVTRGGEYYGFCIEAQEDIPSILTNHHIQKSIEHIKKNNLEKASRAINLFDKFQTHGETVIYYTIDKWLGVNNFDTIFNSDANSIKDIKKYIDKYVGLQRHHPINGKIKILDIGTNIKTKESVVPPEWMGKVFDSANQLHDEMNKLPQRKGKSPVSYCCIYSNSIIRDNIWSDKINLEIGNIIYFVSIDQNSNIVTDIEVVSKSRTFVEPLLIIPNNGSYIHIHNDIFIKNSKKIKTELIGYLSSLLQKCVRRGAYNVNVLDETMKKLNQSPTYNLPDHNFATVSGTRQLLWRSYISIIEDAKGYICDNNSKNSIDMFSLALLAIACQLDSKLSLTDNALNILINTVKTIQCCPDRWNWKSYEKSVTPEIHLRTGRLEGLEQIINSIIICSKTMPMMANDQVMLSMVISYLNDSSNRFYSITTIRDSIGDIGNVDHNEEIQTRCAGMDMHCKPTMLIELQAMINFTYVLKEDEANFILYMPTLEMLAGYIWDNFSSNNFRFGIDEIYCKSIFDEKYIKKHKLNRNVCKEIDNDIYDNICELQEQIVIGRNIQNSPHHVNWVVFHESEIFSIESDKINDHEKQVIGRIAWISIFGKRYRYSYKNKVYDVFMSGDNSEEFLKVKRTVKGKAEYVEGDLRTQIQENFLKGINGIENTITLPNPPESYKWKFTKNKIRIKYDLYSNVFYVDDEEVKTLNLYDQLIKINSCRNDTTEIPEELVKLIKTSTYSPEINVNDCNNWFGSDILHRANDISVSRRVHEDHRVFNWTALVNNSSKHIQNMWRIVMARIYTSDIDGTNGKFTLSVGPCDRRGKKTNNSISYQFEGTLYRLFLMFEALYPFMMNKKSNLGWNVNKTLPEYYHMLNSIKSLCLVGGNAEQLEQFRQFRQVEIITPLWEHQEKTSNRIINGMTKDMKRGFGDASHVGAGKTLCALSVFQKLYQHNRDSLIKTNYSGFLVMLPSAQLIKTWTDELTKHTKGFDVIVQGSNGKLSGLFENKTIYPYTIIITTMGRMRDHPVQHPWILVVIDECLSVQNKEALQTEEAWRQSCYSERGILMLSATFFRSRFDKMLYMIKMLKTGLPEERDYLDAILNESIVSNITESDRVWTITTAKIDMTQSQRKKYDDVYRKNSNGGSDMLYIALNNFINTNINYIEMFYNQIDILEKDNRRILIFTKSKGEADAIINSDRNENRITRYPDKSGNHTVLSFTEGTYGLNDLIIYDTILMRPPEPDKLPQIKGRLDRPGQKSKDLWINYLIIKDTIEEASLLRIEICNNFYNNYLMPLADFYDLAANVKPTNEKFPQKIIKTAKKIKRAKNEHPDVRMVVRRKK